MKQIILIRHAKVDSESKERIYAASLKNWIEQYDNAEICADSLPTQKTIDVVEQADIVVTSKLQRTIDTAKVLDTDIYESNVLFNEAEIPEIEIPFLKCKPNSWLVIARVLSLLGFGKSASSHKTSKLQAKEGSQRLIEFSKKHTTVVLIGHGGMNWLLRKSLVKKGWTLQAGPSSKNWGMTVLLRQ